MMSWIASAYECRLCTTLLNPACVICTVCEQPAVEFLVAVFCHHVSSWIPILTTPPWTLSHWWRLYWPCLLNGQGPKSRLNCSPFTLEIIGNMPIFLSIFFFAYFLAYIFGYFLSILAYFCLVFSSVSQIFIPFNPFVTSVMSWIDLKKKKKSRWWSVRSCCDKQGAVRA